MLKSLIISITVVVVAIPEGLPLAVTIAFSFSSAAMYKQNNLVRKLASAETMGGATHICSDKTGTLTQNKMTVMGLMTSGKVHTAGKVDNAEWVEKARGKSTPTDVEGLGQDLWSLLKQAIIWNGSAFVERANGGFQTQGNVTEQGLLKFFMKVIPGQEMIDFSNELKEEGKVLLRIPFTSARKKASIVVHQPQHEGTDHEVRVYTKGGPDFLMADGLVTRMLNADGSVDPLDGECRFPESLEDADEGEEENHEGMIKTTVKFFADNAFRTILVCYKDMSMAEFYQIKNVDDFESDESKAAIESDLIGIGIFGLQDPLRPGIEDSIAQCKTAGINVIMCTGDNLDTATAISINANIVDAAQVKSGRYTCMTGKDFREAVEGLTDVVEKGKKTKAVKNMKKFKEIKQDLRVLARCSPEDKYILVTGMQDSGQVVAVTGDGTNDAPALSKADVGFSMGITGTDVAKGASDIILMDDNFCSIVVALRYGRSVYDNVRKFLQFQLTVNVVAMFIVFFGAVILKDSPLNAV